MPRWVRWVATGGAVGAMAVGLLALGTAAGSPRGSAPSGSSAGTAGLAPAPADPLAGLQESLRTRPDNAAGWAALGLGYVQRARLTADPTYYGKAQQALARSLQVQPQRNAEALTGQATLAAARHDFARALALTDTSLGINGYSATTYGVRTDALTELGRYDDALASVQRMLDLRPGVDSLARASYQAELHGRVDRARTLLEQAAADATLPADQAFAHTYLGELAWNNGDLEAARAGYDRALRDDPNYLAALVGQSRVLAATGQTTAALAGYREVADRLPFPQYLVEFGTLLQATGQPAAAREQYAVVRATERLFAAQGADVDLELALFEADHGDPATALRYATRAYRKRPDAVLVEDAYAWALHRAGRSAQALPLARRALRLGLRLPSMEYHLGAIAAAAGDRATARAALTRALDLNPHFDPLQAPAARKLLGTLS